MNHLLSITLYGTFPSLNDYISAERTNRHIAAKIKQEQTLRVKYETLGVLPISEYPVKIIFSWFHNNGRTDPDNLCYAKKYILDGLQESGVIKNDNWRCICGFEDKFYIDSINPRIEIEFIKE